MAVFLWDRDGTPEIELARSATGCCPIYISAEGGVLTASWRFEDAALAIANRRPNIDACRILLEHGNCQVRDMVIDGVYMLWPGESLTFGRAGLAFREIDEPDVVLPGSLRDDARATDEFVRIIEDVLRPRIERSSSTVIELSGGLDSSCVAIAASNLRRPLNSYALIHDGAMGNQQRNRRRELVSLLDLRDSTHPSGEPGPLAGLEHQEISLTPFDDIYRIACVAGVARHPDKSIDLLLTGIGGDELSGENTFYRHEWEVKGYSSLSSIASASARCDMFMRMGIWVVHPLVHPYVVDFCRALPSKMRANRLLHFLTLARAGLSDGFLLPRYQEHYGNLIQHEASLFDFEKALEGSLVADYGIQDYGPLLSKAYDAGWGGFSYALITGLYEYLKLDAVLKRYVTA
ncbi:MAG TPA: asparagine synthase-related protein [Allosphingosinicella sp.]